MSWPGTGVAELLGVRYPLLLAPMANSGTPELAAAVSNAGGLGSFGGAYLEPEALRAAIHRIRELTDRPFGINLFAWGPVPETDADARAVLDVLAPLYDELGLAQPEARAPFDPPELLERQLGVVAAERVPVFSFAFGIPPLDDVRASSAVIAGTATTADEAAALEAAGVDLVVAQATEAGGHRGTFLHGFEDALVGGLALVPQVVDRVRVPVVAAGGIMDGRGIAAALALGAGGAQLGTAFLACPESGASEAHKAALARTRDVGTSVTGVFSGRHARAIRTELGARLEDAGVQALPFPVQASLVSPIARAAAERGRPELGFFLAGQASALSRRLGAGELFGALVAETDAALRRLGGAAGT